MLCRRRTNPGGRTSAGRGHPRRSRRSAPVGTGAIFVNVWARARSGVSDSASITVRDQRSNFATIRPPRFLPDETGADSRRAGANRESRRRPVELSESFATVCFALRYGRRAFLVLSRPHRRIFQNRSWRSRPGFAWYALGMSLELAIGQPNGGNGTEKQPPATVDSARQNTFRHRTSST